MRIETTKQEEGVYARNANQIAQMVDALQTKLAAHKAKQVQDPLNWGYVGDLSRVREMLGEALAGL